jgi:hypothetical protein
MKAYIVAEEGSHLERQSPEEVVAVSPEKAHFPFDSRMPRVAAIHLEVVARILLASVASHSFQILCSS